MTQRATVPMILALLVTTVGFATLVFSQEATSPPLIYGAYYAGVLFGVYLFIRVWLPHSDVLLLPLVTFLTGIGLVTIYRLTYNVEGIENLATTQALWILVGSAAMLFIVLFFRNYHSIFEYKYLLALGGLFLIALTFTPLGYEVNGARLWVSIGPINFQPSEFARLALVFFFAGYLADKRTVMAATSSSFLGIQLPSFKYFGPVAVVWALSLGILVFEKDLGSSLIFFAVPLLMLYVATGRIAYIILGSLLFAGGSYLAYLLIGRVQIRVNNWLDPWNDPNGTGYQIVQSLFNISDGGILGTGLGEGFSQTIPEVQTDFIFATIASELGLLGGTVLLLAFLIFVYRGIKISMLAADDASKLLAYGLTSMFALQTLVIVGGCYKGHTAYGITLPFISYGGSSVVGSFILTGLLLVVSEKAGRQESDEYEPESAL